jgi:endonuclease/exonuclease/phosphatase (EEP) superfamily protein YafD
VSQSTVNQSNRSCFARVGQLLRSLLLIGMMIYIISMLMLVVLWNLAPGWTAWLALSNIFAPYLFLPLVVVLPLALLLRAKGVFGASVVLLLVAGVLFVPAVIPSRPLFAAAPVSEQPVLRVVTFNQLSSNNDIDGTLAVLLAQDADVIALQELSHAMAEALERHRADYPFQVLDPLDVPGGLGFVSRYPLDTVEPLEGIRAFRTTADIAGQMVTFINVHTSPPLGSMSIPLTDRQFPGYDPSARNAQLDYLLRVVSNERSLIVAGDFNTAPREQMYKSFANALRDAYAETGWGFGQTFPNSQRLVPQVRIDYIWTSQDIMPLSATVNCKASGSDHCMLIADLHLPAASSANK